MALWAHCVETLLGHAQNIPGELIPEGGLAPGQDISQKPHHYHLILILNHLGQDPTNRLPIKQELIAAQRHDESFWKYSNNTEYDQKNSHVPFPFIATSLVLGASYDPSGYFHQTHILPFYTPYDGGDNNDGQYDFPWMLDMSNDGFEITR